MECSGIPENGPQGPVSSASGNDGSTQRPLCAACIETLLAFSACWFLSDLLSLPGGCSSFYSSPLPVPILCALRLSSQYSGSKNSEQRGEDKRAEKRL